MPKFMLMFNSNDERWEKASKADREAAYAEIGRWWAEHGQAGRIVGGEELQPKSTAKTVRFGDTQGAKPVVTDGPYLETKELIGGYAIVDVPSIDAAVEIAKTWPAAVMASAGGVRSSVEVRPLVER